MQAQAQNTDSALVAAFLAKGGKVTTAPAAAVAPTQGAINKAPKAQAKPAKVVAPATPAQAPASPATPAQAPVTVASTALPKCATARVQVAKPQAKMLQVISWISPNGPVKGLRPKRWHNYAVGQTLQHCKVTPGCDPLDVLFYVANGLMQLRPATQAEMQAAVAAWQGSTQAVA